jgi:hypothetical protein
MQNARVSISRLGDGDKTVADKITKDLKMFLLVINRRIRTHQSRRDQFNIFLQKYGTKSQMKTSLP